MTWAAIPFSAGQYAAQLDAGTLVRYGALLKDVQTGRIVAHMQETGLWQSALREAVSVTVGGGPLNTVGSLFRSVQNEQIKSKLDAVSQSLGAMQGLQVATLSASVLGIGVTVASTAIILNRLSALGAVAERIETRLEQLPGQMREESLYQLLTQLRTQLARLDESGVRSDRIAVLQRADEGLHAAFDQIIGMLNRSTRTGALSTEMYQVSLTALALCAGAQFRTLLLLNEREGAMRRAASMVAQVNDLSWTMPADGWAGMTDGKGDTAADLAGDLRELRARLASQPATARMLLERDIDGRAYIEQAEHETDEVFLLTEVDAPRQ